MNFENEADLQIAVLAHSKIMVKKIYYVKSFLPRTLICCLDGLSMNFLSVNKLLDGVTVLFINTIMSLVCFFPIFPSNDFWNVKFLTIKT